MPTVTIEPATRERWDDLERLVGPKGASVALLNAACDDARSQAVVEGYSIDPSKPRHPAVYGRTGLKVAFDAAGFSECARRSGTRPIMRRPPA